MNLQILEKENKYVSTMGDYCYWKGSVKKYIKVEVKDSYHPIPMRLAEIPKSLGFKEMAQKEVMHYNMYNHRKIGHITKMSKHELNKYINELNSGSHTQRQNWKRK